MKFIRYLFSPFSLFFLIISETRNILYKLKLLKSSNFSIPIINVGNLSLGGTGKTPHVLYLTNLLKNSFQTATLSRGYGRKTKGFILLNEPLNSDKHGDEPMIYKKNYKEISVAVCEQRVKGVMQLLIEKPFTEVILLDDAYQHRPIRAGINILLCDYNNPFYEDYILPLGNLRELRKNANRADVLIISKCPENLSDEKKAEIKNQLKKYSTAPVFFSRVIYGSFHHVFKNEKKDHLKGEKIILVTAIANAKPLHDYLRLNNNLIKHFSFSDHYRFKENDLKKILDEYARHDEVVLVTTEKDAMRFISLPEKQITQLKQLPFYYVGINITFDEQQEEFDKLILDYVTTTARDYQLYTHENTVDS